MKKVWGVLAVMLTASLVLAGCANPNAELFKGGWGKSVTWSDADKEGAIVVVGEEADRGDSSQDGTKINPNKEEEQFPGFWFQYADKKDKGYVKVEGWVFDKFDSFTVTLQTSSGYWDYTIFTADYQIAIDGFLTFELLNSTDKNINNVWISAKEVKAPAEPTIVNLGFIGFYIYHQFQEDEAILNTSFYWQELKEGETIDWDAVDAAYAEWVAGGGLPPFGPYSTSGFGPFTFEHGDPIGWGDFGVDQIEGYYHEFYVSPGHEMQAVDLGFIGYYGQNPETGLPMSTSFYWQTIRNGETIDWDAVDAAYADWVAKGGYEPDRTYWQTSGPASFTFEDYAELGYMDFRAGQLESYYQAFYVDPGYKLPQIPPDDDPHECHHVIYKKCQDKNNCWRFSVRHTVKGKCTTYNHCEKVQKGKTSCTFNYPKYKVTVKCDSKGNITGVSCCKR